MVRIPWHRLLPKHQRIAAFWILAGLGISAPWVIGDWIRFRTTTEAECTISSVHDGDTVRAVCNGEKTKVRLYCVDAPEMGQKPWGKESRDHLRRLAPRGSAVTIRQVDKDRYGRVVGEVLKTAGDNLNLQMVLAGRAPVYPGYCADDRYFQVQGVAKAARSGIWARDGLHQTPWKFRHQ